MTRSEKVTDGQCILIDNAVFIIHYCMGININFSIDTANHPVPLLSQYLKRKIDKTQFCNTFNDVIWSWLNRSEFSVCSQHSMCALSTQFENALQCSELSWELSAESWVHASTHYTVQWIQINKYVDLVKNCVIDVDTDHKSIADNCYQLIMDELKKWAIFSIFHIVILAKYNKVIYLRNEGKS